MKKAEDATPAEIVAYVGDMSKQLAELCREYVPTVASLLDAASELAKVPQP